MAIDATLLNASAAPGSASRAGKTDPGVKADPHDGFGRAMADARAPGGRKAAADAADQTPANTAKPASQETTEPAGQTTVRGTGKPDPAAPGKKDSTGRLAASDAPRAETPTQAGHPAHVFERDGGRLLRDIDAARGNSVKASAKASAATDSAGAGPAVVRIPIADTRLDAPATHSSKDMSVPVHERARSKHMPAGEPADESADSRTANPLLAALAPPLTLHQLTDTQAAGRDERQPAGHVKDVRHGHGHRIDARLLIANQSGVSTADRHGGAQGTTAGLQAAANEALQTRELVFRGLGEHALRPPHRAGDHALRAGDTLFATSLTHAAGQQSAAAAPATSAAAAPSPMAAYNISAPLGSDAWQASISQHSLRLAANGDGEARLTLHPRELGQIQISMKLDASHQAQLHFVSPHAHVRDAIEAALPQLRQAFAAGGLALGQSSVGYQSSPHSSGQFSDEARPGRRLVDEASVVGGDALTMTPVAETQRLLRPLAGGVDTFA